ncbi:MAG: DUF4340 domain-containing protein [Bacteroidia bacterium]|nr:DUF4340 domain-containing protein [Bacteroidia bacterium]
MISRKTLISLLILALVIGTYFFFKRNTNTTLAIDETNFAIEKTQNIDKIFLRSRFQNTSATLTKNDKGVWMINDKYEADGAKVDVLLNAVKNMKVKTPVSKDYWDMVIKNLSSKGVKVEIYSQNNKLKTYYVGGPTPDQMGTFMWMEDASQPYVVYIEGFQGFLSPRFFVNERDWRSKIIFAYEPQDIEWVKVDWTDDVAQSFTITNENNTPSIQSQAFGKGKINENKLRSYLNYFDRLAYEGFPIDMREHDIDSVYNKTRAFFVLTLKPKGKPEQTIQIHYKGLKKNSKMQLDREGVQMPYDIDSYYAFFNSNSKELLMVQDYVFGKVMKKASDFLLE